jgi:hypothetical protein
VTAGTAVWSVPVIRSIAATPAYAQTQTSPGADHSACVAACQAAIEQADPLGEEIACQLHPSCQDLCDELCPNPGTDGGQEGRPCLCPEAADPSTFDVDFDDCTISACGETVVGKPAQA